jgi:PAS domain S-box-containing protein
LELAEWIQSLNLRADALAKLPDGVMITDAHFDRPGPRILYVNEAMSSISGCPAEDLLGRSPKVLHSAQDFDEIRKRMRGALTSGRLCALQLPSCRSDGSAWDAELQIAPLQDESGRRVCFVVTYRDITRQVRAEREASQLAAIVRSTDDAIIGTDLNGDIVAWNRGAERMYGFSTAEAVGRHLSLISPPEFREAQAELLHSASLGCSTSGFETLRVRKDGECIDVAVSMTPIRDSDGGIVGISAIDRDITLRKRAEQEHREREAQLQAIWNTAADAIVCIDSRGVIDDANPATSKMFGYSYDELIGKNVSMLMPSPYRDEHDGYLSRYIRTGEPRIIGAGREVVALRKDGQTFPVDLSVCETDDHRRFTGIVRNISQRRDLQEHLLKVTEEEQRRIGQDLHDGVGQELFALRMVAATLLEVLEHKSAAPAGDPALGLARKLAVGLQESLRQVRALSRGLIPVEIDSQGLASALAELAAEISQIPGVRCTFESPRTVEVADSATAAHLFHIAQEAVTNALRHGRARDVRIRLDQSQGLIVLQVVDDGRGIPHPVPWRAGMGLRTMQHRAELIGGRLQLQAAAGGGTEVSCVLSSASAPAQGRPREKSHES